MIKENEDGSVEADTAQELLDYLAQSDRGVCQDTLSALAKLAKRESEET